jgi:hypothetical protein
MTKHFFDTPPPCWHDPAPHHAQPGHHRHDHDHADRLHAAVRLRVRRRDQLRVGLVCELPAARHSAHHDCFGHLPHRVPALPGYEKRPTDTMPGPVRAFAEHQPVTSIVDAIRELFTTQPVDADFWTALAGVSASSSSRRSSPWSPTAAGSPSRASSEGAALGSGSGFSLDELAPDLGLDQVLVIAAVWALIVRMRSAGASSMVRPRRPPET